MLDVDLRMVCFVLAAVALVLRERLVPALTPAPRLGIRLRTNLAMAGIGVVATRLLAPAGLAGVALLADRHQFGILHLVEVPAAVAGIIGIAALDCSVYWQHRLVHRVKWLWRMHAVHHMDVHIDVSTAVRFHPAEIALSLLLKAALVLLLGIPAWAAAGFEALLAVAALFNHANTRFRAATERVLRWLLIVTPALHRVHHIEQAAGQNRNFGFSTTLWDRLFGTYHAPAEGEDPPARFGVAGVSSTAADSLAGMLAMSTGRSLR